MNFGFLLGITTIIVSWLFLFISCYGWGNLILKIFNFNFLKEDETFIKTWLGWGISIFFFSIIHLLFPINNIVSSLFFISGIVLCLLTSNIFKEIKNNNLSSKKIIAITAFSLLIAAFAIQPPYCYDTGFYHLNSIRWINEYSIIPGIGNLHHRLGFNQLFFTWAAALNFHPWFNDYAFHISNSFLFILLIIQLILSKSVISRSLLFFMFFLPVPHFWIASPSPDIVSSILQICTFNYFILLIINPEKRKYASSYVSFIAIIACIATVIKLSNAPYALGLAFTSWIYFKQNKQNNNDILTCNWKRVSLFIAFLITIWITRGYISTGYPLFPSTFGKINSDWALSERLTVYAADCIRVFAKLGYYDFKSNLLKSSNWVIPWFKYHLTYFDGITAIILFITGFYTYTIWYRKLFINYKKYIVLSSLWFIELLSIAFWFTQAPDIRFAGSLFILFSLTGILILIKNKKIPEYLSKFFILGSFILFSGYFIYYVNNDTFYFINFIKLPKVQTIEKTTDSGLNLKIPVYGDQLWDSELLSTPEFKKGLMLRSQDIQNGFKVVGNSEYVKELEENITTKKIKEQQ